MKAPKCRLCKAEHWRNDPCKLIAVAKTNDEPWLVGKRATEADGIFCEVAERTARATAIIKGDGRPDQPAAPGVLPAGSNPAPASKFDRVAYQREYMRKWRAAQKEKQ